MCGGVSCLGVLWLSKMSNVSARALPRRIQRAAASGSSIRSRRRSGGRDSRLYLNTGDVQPSPSTMTRNAQLSNVSEILDDDLSLAAAEKAPCARCDGCTSAC